MNYKIGGYKMERFSSCNHICATCEFWQGNRTLASNRVQVKVEDRSERGRCWKDKSLSTYGEKASNMCFKWEKWGALDY